MKIAYLVTIVPTAIQSFTRDEIAALERTAQIDKVGLVCRTPLEGWLTAHGATDPRLWWSVAVQLIRQPIRFVRAVLPLVRASWSQPTSLLAALRAVISACDLARRSRPTVIHADFAGPAAVGAFMWSRLSRIPYTVRAHAYDIYRPYPWAGHVLRSADTVIAISDHGRRTIRERWAVEADVVHVGVPLDAIPAREATGIGSPPRLVSAARLVPKKGLEIAVEAAHHLAATGHPVRLDIYGDGELRASLERLSAGPAGVEIKGPIPAADLRRRLRDYDVFVLAARVARDGDMDGIPVVLMEALAAGLPVITTPIAGIPELVEHDRTGCLAQPTAVAFGSALAELIADFPHWLQVAAAGRDRVASQFDVARTSAQLVAIWAKLTGTTLEP